MNWVTWRQHRVEIIISLIVMLLAGLYLWQTGSVIRATENLDTLGAKVQTPLMIALILPFLLGVFVGVPLFSSDLEHGTTRLAWTQSISRSKWFWGKAGFMLVFTVICFSFLVLILNWWNQPIAKVYSSWFNFDGNGIVVLGHALFALCLGVFLGVILGKSVPAMAAFVFAYPGLRYLLLFWRSYYLPPLRSLWDLAGPNPLDRVSGILKINEYALNSSGEREAVEKIYAQCQKFNPAGIDGVMTYLSDLQSCLRKAGYQLETVYQPAERYWAFQLIEFTVFLVLSALFLFLAARWVKKHL